MSGITPLRPLFLSSPSISGGTAVEMAQNVTASGTGAMPHFTNMNDFLKFKLPEGDTCVLFQDEKAGGSSRTVCCIIDSEDKNNNSQGNVLNVIAPYLYPGIEPSMSDPFEPVEVGVGLIVLEKREAPCIAAEEQANFHMPIGAQLEELSNVTSNRGEEVIAVLYRMIESDLGRVGFYSSWEEAQKGMFKSLVGGAHVRCMKVFKSAVLLQRWRVVRSESSPTAYGVVRW